MPGIVAWQYLDCWEKRDDTTQQKKVNCKLTHVRHHIRISSSLVGRISPLFFPNKRASSFFVYYFNSLIFSFPASFKPARSISHLGIQNTTFTVQPITHTHPRCNVSTADPRRAHPVALAAYRHEPIIVHPFRWVVHVSGSSTFLGSIPGSTATPPDLSPSFPLRVSPPGPCPLSRLAVPD